MMITLSALYVGGTLGRISSSSSQSILLIQKNPEGKYNVKLKF